MSSRAELSAVATAVDELVKRVTAITDDLPPTERESIGADLYEVERNLGAAYRRLARIAGG